MASTQAASLTLLRLKRARTQSALDALQVHLPSKRARHGYDASPAEPLHFRRLPASTDISTLGPSRVIDVDPGLLSKRDVSGEPDTVLYNGVPMSREFVDSDECMYDFFGDCDNPKLEHLLAGEVISIDDNVAWLSANNLPIFDDDSDDEDFLSDSDDRSVDYPSTPEASVEQASEDEWRDREIRRLREQLSGEGSEDGEVRSSENGGYWDDHNDSCESEHDGDNYDYEA